MNVAYTNKAKQSAEGFSLLQQATERLEEIAGESGDFATAEWERLDNAVREISSLLDQIPSTHGVLGRLTRMHHRPVDRPASAA